MHNFINDKLPNSFRNFFEPLSEPNRTNSFRISLIKNNFLLSFPTYYIPKMWNSNSNGIKSIVNLKSFKNNLKKNILATYPTATKCNSEFCPDCK